MWERGYGGASRRCLMGGFFNLFPPKRVTMNLVPNQGLLEEQTRSN